jgi:amphi-Trp domain-containing protein
MAEQKFVHESLQDIQSIRSFLDALITSVDKKRLILSSEGQEMVMEMEGLLKFSLRAKKKGGENKLSIKISWSDTPETQTEQSSPVSISS